MPSLFKNIIPLALIAINTVSFAQKNNYAFEYHIHRASSPIRIDGLDTDEAWAAAEVTTDFYQVLPMDTGRAVVRTEVRMLYDDEQLYLLATCFNGSDGEWIVESLRRDFSFGKNDNFLLFLDPFEDQTNGFSFGSNARGAQWDGLMFNGGSIDLSWQNKWESAVTTTTDRWIFEMSVPFKTLRYKKGVNRWGVNFSRLDLKAAEKSAWAPVPRQFPTASLAYTGSLVWDEPPPPPGGNVSVIPYVLGGISKDHEKGTDTNWSSEVGVDAKVALTSSLNLDLTVNPDFSQVEVDVQQTNLDRFELFFPERRQFFLENADLFANFGYSSQRPFFSRRIGLNAPIHYGARLSGKLNKNWRIGALNMQTGEDGEGTPAQNFGVVALQRQVFARSNVAAIFVNKETFDYDQVTDRETIKRYNRNLGLEYNLASQSNLWNGKLLYMKSFSPGLEGRDQIIAGNLDYSAKEWEFSAEFKSVGKNFRAETGFVPRTGFNQLRIDAGHLFFPKSSKIVSHGPSLKVEYFFDENMRYIENETPIIYRVSFLDRSEFRIWTAYNFVELLDPFDPTNFAGDTLATGTKHDWNSFGLNYESKPQGLFTWSANSRYGGYYADGFRLRLGGEMGYRFQPFVAIGVTAQYNHIAFEADERLPEGLKNRDFDLWLIGPRIDLTVSNTIFLTNFIQYNNQAKNVNLNLRFQWRYNPASDLFIVYTNNYQSDFSEVRNRALVLKLTYWWNL